MCGIQHKEPHPRRGREKSNGDQHEEHDIRLQASPRQKVQRPPRPEGAQDTALQNQSAT